MVEAVVGTTIHMYVSLSSIGSSRTQSCMKYRVCIK